LAPSLPGRFSPSPAFRFRLDDGDVLPLLPAVALEGVPGHRRETFDTIRRTKEVERIA